MARLSPQEAADKWANRASAATADVAAGVGRVTTSPGQAAVAKRQKWQDGLSRSGDKWARNTGRVSLGEWQDAMINVGVPRIAQGVQAKKSKFERFASEFFPYLDGVTQRVRAMPDNSPEDRINRMVQQVRETAKFRSGR